MMSGHGANPIFFNKKIKIGRPEHSLTPLAYFRNSKMSMIMMRNQLLHKKL